MKKIICAILACSTLAAAALGFSSCGCNGKGSNSSGNGGSGTPGYVVPTTEPDLKDENFGFYIINSEELMLTKYYGSSKDVEIPATFEGYNVTVIGHSVFNTEDIETAVVPDTVTEIQDYAFASNSNLTSVKLSSNLKVLGTNVFFNCKSLESIELPDTLEQMGPYVFCAAGLTSVVIPESKNLSTLSQYAFFQCPNLKEVTIPVSITSIPDDTFNQCPNDMVIKAYSDSYALSYAQNHNINYEELARE